MTATLICYRLRWVYKRLSPQAEAGMTEWTSLAEAEEASMLLSPCDDGTFCTFDHLICYSDRGRVRVRRAPKPKQPKEKTLDEH